MRLTPIQASFSAGEISPDLYGRVDLPQYAQGVKTLVNMFTTAHGSAVRRGGFEFRSSYGNSTSGTLVPFPNYNARGMMVLFADDGAIYLHAETFGTPPSAPPNSPPNTAERSIAVPDPYNQLLQNNSFEELSNWHIEHVANLADISGDVDDKTYIENGALYMYTQRYNLQHWYGGRVTQEVAMPDTEGMYFLKINNRNVVDIVDPNTFIVITITNAKPKTPVWGDNRGKHYFPWFEWWGKPENRVAYGIYPTDGTADEYGMLFEARGNDRLWITISLEQRCIPEAIGGSGGYPDQPGWHEITGIEGWAEITEIELREMVHLDDPADESAAPIVSGDPHQPTDPIYTLTFAGTHPYNADQLPWIQYTYTPDEYGIIITHVNHHPRKFSFDILTGTYSWALLPFNTSPTEWGSNNWPRCAAFHGRRLWFAGSIKEPFRLWGSKVDDWTRLGVPTSPVDDDALQFDLHNRENIHWLLSHRDLVLGTDIGEYIITSQGGAITHSDNQLIQQGATGCHAIQPIKMDDKIFFVSADGHRLYSYGFSDTLDGYRAQELTINARHLLRRATIKQIVLDQHPHRIIWVRTNTGTMLSMTYEETPDGLVAAWARHTMNASVRSMGVSNGMRESYLYILALRHINSQWVLCLEKLSDEEYLDSYTKMSNPSNSTTFASVEAAHLAGDHVKVLARQYNDPYGVIHRDLRVASNPPGQIVLDYEAREVVIGYSYTSYIETLPIDLGGRESSMGPAIKRFAQVYARIVLSHKPVINGVLPPERYPQSNMNTVSRPRTEDLRVSNLGHDQQATITIYQDKPFSLYLAGIYGKLTFDTP